jgi:hypothetical protein
LLGTLVLFCENSSRKSETAFLSTSHAGTVRKGLFVMLTANQPRKVALYYLLMSFPVTALNVAGYANKEAVQSMAVSSSNRLQ